MGLLGAWPYPDSVCADCGQPLAEGDEFIPLTVFRADAKRRWRDASTVVLVHVRCLIRRARP